MWQFLCFPGLYNKLYFRTNYMSTTKVYTTCQIRPSYVWHRAIKHFIVKQLDKYKTDPWLNYPTPWSRVYVEKLIVTRLVKKFPWFMCPYPELDELSTSSLCKKHFLSFPCMQVHPPYHHPQSSLQYHYLVNLPQQSSNNDSSSTAIRNSKTVFMSLRIIKNTKHGTY